MKITPTQLKLLLALPHSPSDGKLCKGPNLATANVLARKGLARCTGISPSGRHYFAVPKLGQQWLASRERGEHEPQ